MKNSSIKYANKKGIARYILKAGETSRPVIAADLGLSMPTVLQNTNELIEEGLVQEVGQSHSTGGRKARALSIAPLHRIAAGIDVTANHISYVLIDLCGTVLAKKRLKKPFSHQQDYYEEICQELEIFLTEAQADRSRLLGVGISIPGIIDKQQELLIRSHILKLNHVSLKSLSQRIPYDTIFENDANSAQAAEMRDLNRSTVYLSLSNTVGGSFCMNGSVYPGDNFRSAEFGHMILHPHGRRCYCGKQGCVDAYCSAQVLLQHADSLEQFFTRLEDGDPDLCRIWEEYLDDLAMVVTNLRMAYDCDVMLGGYMGGWLKRYMPQLNRHLLPYNMFESDTLYVQTCKYEREASAVGAAMLFLDRYFDSLA